MYSPVRDMINTLREMIN